MPYLYSIVSTGTKRSTSKMAHSKLATGSWFHIGLSAALFGLSRTW